MDITSIALDVYNTFKTKLLTTAATLVPALLTQAVGYVDDSKKSMIDLAEGALKGELSWVDVEIKVVQQGKILETALVSIEQNVAANIQAMISGLLIDFKNMLLAEALKLNQA